MMKFFFCIIFMSLMVIKKSFLMMFLYNLCYLLSFMMLFFYMNKNDLWMMVGFYFGYDYYSYYLIFLSLWILGLMFMTLASEKSKLKLLIFLFMLLILLITFSTYNMIMFYFFFEVSLVPTFMLVVYWGYNPERISAGYYLLLYTLFISMPLLIYIIKLNYDVGSFDFNLLIMLKLKSLGLFEYLMYMGSFFIKMPMFLFHIWLPKAHVEAPVYGSMVLAAILLKLGSYGLLRFIMILLKSMLKFNYLIFSVGIIGSILMSLVCLVQVDMKSLVAYSSVVHMNLMLCGMMVMTKMSFIGSYILMISHGLCSSGMFYMVNSYYYRTFSRFLVLNKGLVNLIPAMSLWWFMLCIINFSFPLSMNFMGEIFILSVILNWDINMMMYLMMISFFSSCYSLYLFSYVQHGSVVKSGVMNSGKFKEFVVLILHVYPLVLMLINLVMWMI